MDYDFYGIDKVCVQLFDMRIGDWGGVPYIYAKYKNNMDKMSVGRCKTGNRQRRYWKLGLWWLTNKKMPEGLVHTYLNIHPLACLFVASLAHLAVDLYSETQI
jgi:hypothetical protein